MQELWGWGLDSHFGSSTCWLCGIKWNTWVQWWWVCSKTTKKETVIFVKMCSIYLRGIVTQKGRDTERNHLSESSLPKWPQWLGLGQRKARSPLRQQGSMHLGYLPAFPGSLAERWIPRRAIKTQTNVLIWTASVADRGLNICITMPAHLPLF